jgi:GDP-L-fucose synthase
MRQIENICLLTRVLVLGVLLSLFSCANANSHTDLETALTQEAPYDFMGKRVFVAGHNGMVGSALVRRLQSEGCEIVTKSHSELDLLNQAAVQAFFETAHIDVVFLAAAKVGGILANNTYPAEFIYQNLMIEANFIHSAYLNKVRKLIFLGSSCIYPKNCPQPIKEEYLLSSSLEKTNEAYAVAKISGLKMVEYYRRQYGVDYSAVMPTNLYGINDTYSAQNSHVIPGLILKMHKAKQEGSLNVMLWGTGTPMREFLYADDLADGCVFVAKYYKGTTHLNIGTGRDITIAELAVAVKKVVGFEGEVCFDPDMPDGTMRKVLDVSQINSLGWCARTTLEDGLKIAYSDFLSRFG